MARPTLMPRLVAAIQSHGTNCLSASHCAVPTTAPAIKPPAIAAPTESIAPTIRFAINPPIGKPRRAASGQAQRRGRLSVEVPVREEVWGSEDMRFLPFAVVGCARAVLLGRAPRLLAQGPARRRVPRARPGRGLRRGGSGPP